MIADYFPPDRLGRAIGVYATGVYIGSGLALVLGGAAIRLITQSGPWTCPWWAPSFPGSSPSSW